VARLLRLMKLLRLVRLVKFLNMLEDWTAVSPAMFAFAMTVVKVPTYLSRPPAKLAPISSPSGPSLPPYLPSLRSIPGPVASSFTSPMPSPSHHTTRCVLPSHAPSVHPVTTRCALPRAQQVIFISHMICCMWWGLSQTISTETWADKAHLVYDTLGDAPFQVRPV